jgi:hypothetical protein
VSTKSLPDKTCEEMVLKLRYFQLKLGSSFQIAEIFFKYTMQKTPRNYVKNFEIHIYVLYKVFEEI